jgi:hypothetical protein
LLANAIFIAWETLMTALIAEYGIKRLNHGIGYNTAAIELLLSDLRGQARAQGQDRHALGAPAAAHLLWLREL